MMSDVAKISTDEKSECDKWLDELGKLMDEFDAGKINEMEYRKLCFELDKKFNIADDNDEDFYLNSNDDEFEIEENTISDMDKEIDFVEPLTAHL
ncbi:MAG: hypothetical protein IJS29_01565 [Selenomonadaceae bacterium]|nr:hypothetical protein [Selenomonadaceae bacterium]